MSWIILERNVRNASIVKAEAVLHWFLIQLESQYPLSGLVHLVLFDEGGYFSYGGGEPASASFSRPSAKKLNKGMLKFRMKIRMCVED